MPIKTLFLCLLLAILHGCGGGSASTVTSPVGEPPAEDIGQEDGGDPPQDNTPPRETPKTDNAQGEIYVSFQRQIDTQTTDMFTQAMDEPSTIV